MEALLNRFRFEVERVQGLKEHTQLGVITSYDPNAYAVKVALQPSGKETGFIPLTSPFIGNGWGMFLGPSPGDQVTVEFHAGDHEVPIATLRLFDDKNRPLPAPSGEMWFVHKTGTAIKFTNDGKLTLHSGSSLTLDCGDVELGNGSLLTLVTSAFQSVYNLHTHTVTAVGAPTTPPLIGGQMLPTHLTTNTKAS